MEEKLSAHTEPNELILAWWKFASVWEYIAVPLNLLATGAFGLLGEVLRELLLITFLPHRHRSFEVEDGKPKSDVWRSRLPWPLMRILNVAVLVAILSALGLYAPFVTAIESFFPLQGLAMLFKLASISSDYQIQLALGCLGGFGAIFGQALVYFSPSHWSLTGLGQKFAAKESSAWPRLEGVLLEIAKLFFVPHLFLVRRMQSGDLDGHKDGMSFLLRILNLGLWGGLFTLMGMTLGFNGLSLLYVGLVGAGVAAAVQVHDSITRLMAKIAKKPGGELAPAQWAFFLHGIFLNPLQYGQWKGLPKGGIHEMALVTIHLVMRAGVAALIANALVGPFLGMPVTMSVFGVLSVSYALSRLYWQSNEVEPKYGQWLSMAMADEQERSFLSFIVHGLTWLLLRLLVWIPFLPHRN